MSDTKCVICNADFRPSALVTSVGGLKKCGPCEKDYPQAFSREEVQIKTKNKTQSLDEERVRELVYEILEAANIKRYKCEKCGKMFFPRGPMHDVCPECKQNAVDEKGAK